MNLRQLRYFVTLSEELHFHRAARRLNITQSPLTLAIQELERELGGKLFNRTRRSVELTEAGRAFQRDARDILDHVRLSLESTRQLMTQGTPFRLGCASGTTLLAFFPDTIQEFCTINPSVQLSIMQIDSGQQADALKRREVDACFVRSPSVAQSIHVDRVKLMTEQWMVVFHREHRLRDHTSLSLEDLQAESFIQQRSGCGSEVREMFDSLCAHTSFVPRVAHEVHDPAMMVSLAAAGQGIAILPRELACIQVPDRRTVPLVHPNGFADICLAFRTADDDPRVSSLRKIATATVRRTQGTHPSAAENSQLNSIIQRRNASSSTCSTISENDCRDSS